MIDDALMGAGYFVGLGIASGVCIRMVAGGLGSLMRLALSIARSL